jgi:HAD superfamily hydrolase (TIGR01509 family)
MTPTTIDTILFDLDGTLVDTEMSAAKSIRAVFHAWGIAIEDSDAGYITGRTWKAAADFLSTKYRLPVSHDQACRQMIEAYRETLENDLVIVPGGAAAVRALVAHGHSVALVSGSNRAEILWALDQLKIRDQFKIILGAEDYPNSKPAPDGYLKALQMMGRDPRRTLVFEDSRAGISSALAAGAWVVAISGTNHFKQDTSHAHHHIPDLREVTPAWIAQLEKRFV